jgi:hypothetical protein
VLLNYKTIWEQTQDHLGGAFIGGVNRYRHYTHSYTAADTDIVTPNNDSPYSWAWFDVRREPVVLRVPKVGRIAITSRNCLTCSPSTSPTSACTRPGSRRATT